MLLSKCAENVTCTPKLPCYCETGCPENVWLHELVAGWTEYVCCYAAGHPSHVSPHWPERKQIYVHYKRPIIYFT